MVAEYVSGTDERRRERGGMISDWLVGTAPSIVEFIGGEANLCFGAGYALSHNRNSACGKILYEKQPLS